MTRTPRTVALLAAIVAAVTVAGPALAADVSTTKPVMVLLAGDMPSRTFAVENVSGGALSSIDLGRGGGQPFRTRVVDEELTGSYGGFDVEAEMSNFYRKDGSTYEWSSMIPSSSASLEFPASPVAASGVVFSVIPKIQLSASETCANSDDVRSALGLPLLGSLPILGTLTGVTKTVCDALAAATTGNAVVSGAEATVNSALTALTDLPVKLTGAVGGSSQAFTNASFAPGSVAEGRGSGQPAATKVPIMSGSTDPSADLIAQVQSTLNGLTALPLVSSTGVGSKLSLDQLLGGLQASTGSLKTLGDAVASLTSSSSQLSVLNQLTGTVQAVTGADLSSIGGQYVGLPTLKAAPTSVPAAGQYAGTLTVTFIQH